VIPAKRDGASWEIQDYRAEMRAEFPRKLYRRRALVESVFSAVKRKLSTSPWKGTPNAADTGFVTGAGLQPLPAQAVLGLRVVERAS
jgi:hypothetical protein